MLTDRQISLIQAIIDRYIETSEPVGSVEIVNNYNMSCSAATIRNEMAKLIELGYLEMLHTSSGRVPTRVAYRYYLSDIMNESDIPVLQEVAMKQRLWPKRFSLEKLLQEAVTALADNTKTLSIAMTEDNYVVNSGSVYLLDHREFWDIDAAKAALLLSDNHALLTKLFEAIPTTENRVEVLIEQELGIEKMDKAAVVFAKIRRDGKTGHIAVIGPSRMNYASVIPAVRYTKNLIEELI